MPGRINAMKLVTFIHEKTTGIGIVDGGKVLDCTSAWRRFGRGEAPADMLGLIAGGETALEQLRDVLQSAGRSPEDPQLWKPLARVRLQAPIPLPAKNVFCVGRNYKAHIEEGARARGREVVFPPVPEFFSKPPTTVIGHDDDVRINTRQMQQLDYEVELGLVIGRKARDVASDAALESIFGYTIINDITARDLQVLHGQWFKGKSLDTSCPMGPWILPSDEFGEPSGHRITLRVNSQTRQDSSTSDMLFGCADIVASLSEGLTLEPGDIVATGTPSGVALGMSPQAWLKDGDVVEAEIDGIGVLRNRIRTSGN
jgi:2-keto-4-pentenoate hydratase/2-oxohepta-3-ene-1,7-dioic acid hydratase in catechol pathway